MEYIQLNVLNTLNKPKMDPIRTNGQLKERKRYLEDPHAVFYWLIKFV